MSIVNQMSAETPPLKLCDEPFVDFLGFREEMQHGEIQYFMDFRDSHIGNPMIGRFMAAFSRVLVKWPPPPILPVSVVIMSCPYAPR